MGNRGKGLEGFLMTYPHLNRWVNECLSCHHKGYKPEMPEPEFDNWAVLRARLRRLLDEMEVDQDGLCKQCRQAAPRANS